MAGWVLVPSLVSLRAEFDALSPRRDHASDGAIGDAAHMAESSDHNSDDTPGSRTPSTDADSIPEVHAIDVTSAGLWPAGLPFEKQIQTIVERHRQGADDRLQNVIYNRRIWSRSWGWTARAYTGPSPHTEHGHFSARYGSGTAAQGNPEADTRPWGLLDALKALQGDDMAGITQDDFNVRMDAWWNDRMNPPAVGANPNPALVKLRVAPWHQLVGRSGKTTHELLFGDMLALLKQAAGDDDVDEQAIVTGILTALNPQQIALAVVAALPADEAKKVVDELTARLATARLAG